MSAARPPASAVTWLQAWPVRWVAGIACGALIAVGLEASLGSGVPYLKVAGYGMVSAAVVLIWVALVPRLGRLTALAATSVVSGLAAAVFGAALASACEGCVLRLAVAEMLLVGLFLPLLIATLVVPPYAAFRFARRSAPHVVVWLKQLRR